MREWVFTVPTNYAIHFSRIRFSLMIVGCVSINSSAHFKEQTNTLSRLLLSRRRLLVFIIARFSPNPFQIECMHRWRFCDFWQRDCRNGVVLGTSDMSKRGVPLPKCGRCSAWERDKMREARGGLKVGIERARQAQTISGAAGAGEHWGYRVPGSWVMNIHATRSIAGSEKGRHSGPSYYVSGNSANFFGIIIQHRGKQVGSSIDRPIAILFWIKKKKKNPIRKQTKSTAIKFNSTSFR